LAVALSSIPTPPIIELTELEEFFHAGAETKVFSNIMIFKFDVRVIETMFLDIDDLNIKCDSREDKFRQFV